MESKVFGRRDLSVRSDGPGWQPRFVLCPKEGRFKGLEKFVAHGA